MSSRRSQVPGKLLIRKINKRHWIPASAGMTHKWDSSGDVVINYLLYGQIIFTTSPLILENLIKQNNSNGDCYRFYSF